MAEWGRLKDERGEDDPEGKAQYGARDIAMYPTMEDAIAAIGRGIRKDGEWFGLTDVRELAEEKRQWAAGFHTPGGMTVVILDNVNGVEDVPRLLAHEIVGHGETNAQFGRGNVVKWVESIKSEEFERAKERAKRNFMAATGADAGSAREAVKSALNEVFAHYVPEHLGENPGRLEKIAHAVNAAARWLGLRKTYTTADVKTMIAKWRKAVRGEGGGVYGEWETGNGERFEFFEAKPGNGGRGKGNVANVEMLPVGNVANVANEVDVSRRAAEVRQTQSEGAKAKDAAEARVEVKPEAGNGEGKPGARGIVDEMEKLAGEVPVAKSSSGNEGGKDWDSPQAKAFSKRYGELVEGSSYEELARICEHLEERGLSDTEQWDTLPNDVDVRLKGEASSLALTAKEKKAVERFRKNPTPENGAAVDRLFAGRNAPKGHDAVEAQARAFIKEMNELEEKDRREREAAKARAGAEQREKAFVGQEMVGAGSDGKPIKGRIVEVVHISDEGKYAYVVEGEDGKRYGIDEEVLQAGVKRTGAEYQAWLKKSGRKDTAKARAEFYERAIQRAAGETRSGETRNGETRSGETRSGETRSGETRSGETRDGGKNAAAPKDAAAPKEGAPEEYRAWLKRYGLKDTEARREEWEKKRAAREAWAESGYRDALKTVKKWLKVENPEEADIAGMREKAAAPGGGDEAARGRTEALIALDRIEAWRKRGETTAKVEPGEVKVEDERGYKAWLAENRGEDTAQNRLAWKKKNVANVGTLPVDKANVANEETGSAEKAKRVEVVPTDAEEVKAGSVEGAAQVKVQKDYVADAVAEVKKNAEVLAELEAEKEYLKKNKGGLYRTEKQIHVRVPADGELTVPMTAAGMKTLDKWAGLFKAANPTSDGGLRAPKAPKTGVAMPKADAEASGAKSLQAAFCSKEAWRALSKPIVDEERGVVYFSDGKKFAARPLKEGEKIPGALSAKDYSDVTDTDGKKVTAQERYQDLLRKARIIAGAGDGGTTFEAVDLAELYKALAQTGAVVKSGGKPVVALYRDKSGKLLVEATDGRDSDSAGRYRMDGDWASAKEIAQAEPEVLTTLAREALRMGNETADVRIGELWGGGVLAMDLKDGAKMVAVLTRDAQPGREAELWEAGGGTRSGETPGAKGKGAAKEAAAKVAPKDAVAAMRSLGDLAGADVATLERAYRREANAKKKALIKTLLDYKKQAGAMPERPQDGSEDANGEVDFDTPEMGVEDDNVLSGDEVRKTMPGFDPRDWATHVDRTGFVGPRMAARLQKLLETRKGKGDGTVVFLAGGNGAGKSTVANTPEVRGADFVIDSTLGNLEVAKKQIDAILANGQTPEIRFVYREPGQALQGIADRVRRGGHIVSPLSFANSHVKSRENLRLLADEYGDRIRIHIHDNSVPGAPEITLEQLEAKRKPDHARIREIANHYLGNLRSRATQDGGDSQSANRSGAAGSGAQGQGQVDFYTPNLFTGSAADYANRDEEGNIVNGPSLQRIGTGEGTQVYGWGLYASNRRGVAETYARADADRKRGHASYQRADVLFDGEQMRDNDTLRREYLGLIAQLESYGSVDSALQNYEYFRDHGGLRGHEQKDYEFLLQNRDRIKVVDVKHQPQHVYEQTFFTNRATPEETERHLLKWYEPVAEEQKEWIADELNKSIDDPKMKWVVTENGLKPDNPYAIEHAIKTGQDAYDFALIQAATIAGSRNAQEFPRLASEFLARAGIDGVKYPVDSFGGKTVKDGDKAGWNYVSFRDDNIRVDHKWTDGQLDFDTREFSAAEREEEKTPAVTGALGHHSENAPRAGSASLQPKVALDRKAKVSQGTVAILPQDGGEVKRRIRAYKNGDARIRVNTVPAMLSDLGAALKMRYAGGSRYAIYQTPKGETTLRLSDHNASGGNFSKDPADRHISVYVEGRTFDRDSTPIPFTEIRFSREEYLRNARGVADEIVDGVESLIETGDFKIGELGEKIDHRPGDDVDFYSPELGVLGVGRRGALAGLAAVAPYGMEENFEAGERLQTASDAEARREMRGADGERADGTRKGLGFFGPLKTRDGRIMTEFSAGFEYDGKETEVPLVNPLLDRRELEYLLNGYANPNDKIMDGIWRKAEEWGMRRLAEGKSPFIVEGEKRAAIPGWETGGASGELDFDTPELRGDGRGGIRSRAGTVAERVPKDERGAFRGEFNKVMAEYARHNGGEEPKSCGLFAGNAYYIFDIIGGNPVNVHRIGINERNREKIIALDEKHKREIYAGARDSAYWADRFANELSKHLQAGDVAENGSGSAGAGAVDSRAAGGDGRVSAAGGDNAARWGETVSVEPGAFAPGTGRDSVATGRGTQNGDSGTKREAGRGLVDFDTREFSAAEREEAEREYLGRDERDKAPNDEDDQRVFGFRNRDLAVQMKARGLEPAKGKKKPFETTVRQAQELASNPETVDKIAKAVDGFQRGTTDYETVALGMRHKQLEREVDRLAQEVAEREADVALSLECESIPGRRRGERRGGRGMRRRNLRRISRRGGRARTGRRP